MLSNQNINSFLPAPIHPFSAENHGNEQDQKIHVFSQEIRRLNTQQVYSEETEKLFHSKVRRILFCHFILHSKLKRILRRSFHKSSIFQQEEERKIRGSLKPINRLNENWSKMYHKIKEIEPKLSDEGRKHLRFFLIQYLAKVGTCSTSETYLTRYLTSPIQQNDFGYFRSSTNPFLNVLEEKLCKELNLPSDPCVVTKVLALSNGPAVFDDLQKRNELCLLNLDDDDHEITLKLRASWENPLDSKKYIAYHLSSLDNPSTPNVIQIGYEFLKRVATISNQLQISAPILSFGKKDETYFLLLQTHLSPYLISFNPLNSNGIPYCHSYIENEIKKLREYNGYVPTLQQTARVLSSKNISFEELFKSFGVIIEPMATEADSKNLNAIVFIPKTIPLITKNQNFNHFIPSLEKFISNPTFKTFSKSKSQEELPIAIKLLCSNVVSYIEGFKDLPLDESFEKHGLKPFLEESYLRVLNYMEVIMRIGFKQDQYCQNKLGSVTLSNYQNLIFEELLLWTDVTRDTKSTEESLNKILSHKVLSNAKLRPSLAFMMNTGVRCATVIRKACQSISENLNIFCFQDSYYEIGLGANTALKNSVIMINSPYAIDHFESNLQLFERENKKLGLIYVDFHGSLNVETTVISSHNIEEYIELTFERKVAQTPLTIAMDITIGKINDDSFCNLINKFKTKIESGELNLVFFRTIQKFDSFGTDKISGGYIQVYSEHKEFIDSFQKIKMVEDTDIDPINKKSLVHFYENCLEGLDQYRQQIFDNARYVYDRIKKEYVFPSNLTMHLPFFVSEIDDKENFFISINVNYNFSIVDDLIKEFNEFGAMSRPSFGYSHFTYVNIPRGNKITYRMCFGLEEKERLDIFVNKLNTKLDIYNNFNKEYFDRMMLEIDPDGICSEIEKPCLNQICNLYLGKYFQNNEGLIIEDYVNAIISPILLNYFLNNNHSKGFISLLQKLKFKRMINRLIIQGYPPSLVSLVIQKYENFTVKEFHEFISNYENMALNLNNLTFKFIDECHKEFYDQIYNSLTQDGSCKDMDPIFLENFCKREMYKYFENNQSLTFDEFVNLSTIPLLLDVFLNCQDYNKFLLILDKKFIKKGTVHQLIEPWAPSVLKNLVYKQLIDLTAQELSDFFANIPHSEMTLYNFKSKFIFELLFKKLKNKMSQYGANVVESIAKEIAGYEKNLVEAREAWIKRIASDNISTQNSINANIPQI